jgi:hypothetical protein
VDGQSIECLNCGAKRPSAAAREECSRCGYLGWAESNSLSETLRRTLRERPVALRRAARLTI